MPIDQATKDSTRKQANQKRKLDALENPMFRPDPQPGFSYDNSNTSKFANEWSLRQLHMLIVCLSLHGTSRIDEIVKYSIFRGFKESHLNAKMYTLLRFHSTKPLSRFNFDVYMIRDFFMDAQQAQSEGFLLDKHHRYFHPTMTVQELERFFLQFELTEYRRTAFKRLRDQLDIPFMVWFDRNRLTTIEKIVFLYKLEQDLA